MSQPSEVPCHQVHAPGELQALCERVRKQGATVGFVPTMGALHAGHRALIDCARRNCGFLVVSIFVNPLQFGPAEDLNQYPRTWPEDVAQCKEAGVDAVFGPSVQQMYPAGAMTRVQVEQLTEPMEGRARPGHFDGVTTVVAKLFNLMGPCEAFFGRKDYQQWKVISKMVRDLNMPVTVHDHPIVRAPDGVALSSRNARLDPAQRGRARAIPAALSRAWELFERGERDTESLRQACLDRLAGHTQVDYVSLADPNDLQPASASVPDSALLAVAARVDEVRLIDNVVLGRDPHPLRPEQGHEGSS